MGKTIKFDNEGLCQICHKRKATRLCDYIIGEAGFSIACGGGWLTNKCVDRSPMTCDALLCDCCARRVCNMDFCPVHAQEVKNNF